MPMLNLLRPHRRSASAQSMTTQDGLHQQQQNQQYNSRPQHAHAQPATAIHFLPQSQRQSASTSPAPSQASIDHSSTAASTLPPLNFDSQGLLGTTSPNGFLGGAFGSSSNSLASPVAPASATAISSPTPVIITTGSSPRLGRSPSLNKALPAPPPLAQTPPPTLQLPQTLQSPSSPSPAHSRPGTGGGGGHGKQKEKEKEVHTTPPPAASGHGKRNHAKLNILSSMTLLMRRRTGQSGTLGESSRKAGARDLPDDFDPGIIYATRHPDWSSPGPKRPPVEVINARAGKDGKVLSPALAGVMRGEGEEHMERQRTPLFKEHFGELEATGPKMQVGSQGSPQPQQKKIGVQAGEVRVYGPPPPQPQLGLVPPAEVKTPQMVQSPQMGATSSPAVSMGTTLVEKSPPVGAPEITLVTSDSPANNLAPAKSNASSTSSSSSSAPSENDDAYPPIRRKGVTLVDHPLSLPRHLMNNSSRFSFEASSATGSSPGIEDEPAAGTGGSQTLTDGNTIGLAMTKDGTPSPTRQQMMGGIGLGLGLGVGTTAGAYKRRSLRKAPARWRDEDSEDEDGVVNIASYENEEDDLYYDDGIILGDDDGEEQGFGNGEDYGGMESARLELGGLPPQVPLTHTPMTGPELGSSGNDLVVETASLEHTIGGVRDKEGPSAFPPFMNPIGGGLGYQKQLEHFYTSDVMRLNAHGLPLALQTLDQSLCKIKQKQQGLQRQDSDELDSPAPGFGSEIDPGYISLQQPQHHLQLGVGDGEEPMSFDDEDDMDDPMVAAANAEVLAYDTDGEYGQEFGFYSASEAGNVSEEQLFAGGYFGEAGMNLGQPRPFLVRRPSLTPISERSECSYRNSMVFGFENTPGSRGGGAGSALGGSVHPLALSQTLAGLTLDGDGSVGQGGQAQGAQDDMNLNQLLKFRRSWGGAKSAPGSPGGPGRLDAGAAGNGGQSPAMSSSSPVVSPGQGVSLGGRGMSPGAYGMYGLHDWTDLPVNMNMAGMSFAGMNMSLGVPPMGVGMTPGLTIQQQINQSGGGGTSPGGLMAGSAVGQQQLLQVLMNNAQKDGGVSAYPLHMYQPVVGSPAGAAGQNLQQQVFMQQSADQQAHMQQQHEQPSDADEDDYEAEYPDLDDYPDDSEYPVDHDPVEIYPGTSHPNSDITASDPYSHQNSGLARNTSAGRQSTAGDSSYASALGSPTSEAEKGEERVSLDGVGLGQGHGVQMGFAYEGVLGRRRSERSG
ncbi:hypothetical protein BGX38DRAFT_1276463 [Terfezia claveryi]|nr:hypothetical protein BGX38DRAFT_1276463 [Terfezia claveryi]